MTQAHRLLVWMLMLAAVPAAAQEAGGGERRGLALARQARAALLAGDATGAEKLLEQARVEWPGSPLLAALSGDVMVASEAWSRALADYGDAVTADDDALTRHALFNRAVTASTSAEAALAEAGVPLDPAGLPEQGAPPGLIPALEAGIPAVRRARDDFLAANDLAPGDAARRSIAALNRRLDDLEQMLDELRQREEDEGDEQGDEQGDEGEQGEQGDQQDGEQGQDGDRRQGDDGQPDDGGQDEPEDQQDPPDEEQGEDQPSPEQQQPDGQDPEAPPEQAPGDLTDLTPEEMQRLIEQLENLERRARELQKARQERNRRAPEKDW